MPLDLDLERHHLSFVRVAQTGARRRVDPPARQMGEELDRPWVGPAEQAHRRRGDCRTHAGQCRQRREQRMEERRPQIVRVRLGRRWAIG